MTSDVILVEAMPLVPDALKPKAFSLRAGVLLMARSRAPRRDAASRLIALGTDPSRLLSVRIRTKRATYTTKPVSLREAAR